MAVTPVNISRVSQNMRTDLLLSGMQKSMVNLLHQQEKLSTGLRIVRPSDDPIGATAAIRMDDVLEAQDQYLNNIDNASKSMDLADSTIGSMRDLITQAHDIALENVGSTASTEQRHAASTIVESIMGQIVTLGNAEYLGSYLFAGQVNNTPPFAVKDNKVSFNGNQKPITVQVAPDISENISLTSGELFGSGSGIVAGTSNLTPSAGNDTRLTDLNGALGRGIRLSSMVISGSTIGDVQVDLTGAATLGNVVDKINQALPSTVRASLSANGRNMILSSTNPGETLKITESGQGTVAHDLGIYTPTATASPVNGTDFSPKLTLQTKVSDLASGAGLDLTSGIVINNMDTSITIDFSSADTLQDVLNTINTAEIGVKAEINDDATGINITNLYAGSKLTIGENGGTTAKDLGIRTFTADTLLSKLNDGEGVSTVS